jgi:hypothetical protein
MHSVKFFSEPPTHPLHNFINDYNAKVFLTEHSTANAFLETVKIECKKLFNALENVCGGKYKNCINMSDLIFALTELNVLKNYTPDSCVNYVDPTSNDSKMDKDNECTRWYYWLLAKHILLEAGEEWTMRI